MNKASSGKKPLPLARRLLISSLLVMLIAALALVYLRFSEKPVEGSKQITLSVVSSTGETTHYPLRTDAQFLVQAMKEAEGLTFSGEQGPYGLMIHTVNGELADYNVNGAYWSFLINGEYGNYGADSQPIEDGDSIEIAYTR